MPRSWALAMSPKYREEFSRVQRKYQNQISRKTQDLMHDPTPGGSRTVLTQYDGLCRLRTGEYRIIYAYDDQLVQLLSLRKRNERTYNDLDQLELQQLEPFRSATNRKPASPQLPPWEKIVRNWVAPREEEPKPLPFPIDTALLDELDIPAEYRTILLRMRTEDDLLGCDTVPAHICEKIIEAMFPLRLELIVGDPLPVVVLDDLVDEAAATVNGPIDTAEKSDVPAATDGIPKPLFLIPIKRMGSMTAYSGNTAKANGKEARYTVKLDSSIQLTYAASNSERALLTTDGHDELVQLVNDAKRSGGATKGGGGFFINEFRHVLVPTQNGLLYAGKYTRDLEFVFNTTVVSPVAPSGISRGDVWPGPHVGIKYTLAAGASNIRYERDTRQGTRERVSLSHYHDSQALQALLQMFRAVKPSGGAIYVNEARECFAPVAGEQGYERLYIGHLGNKPWFPEPE